jgi:adenylate cyclase
VIHTVLIVDDEPDMEALVLQKFRRRIGAGGIRFVTAQDGVEALEVLANDAVDLIVSDINMPRMDGLSLLEKLQERELEIATIIVSAYGDMTNIRTAMNRGAFDFLTKPIDLQDLERTIDKTLQQIERMRRMSRDRAEAERARSALARYFSPKLADQLATDPRFMQLGGERRVGTFLFTDLADFTPLVESGDPGAVVQLLNEYLDGVTQAVFAHEGTVVKILGDAVYAMFGAPAEQADHAARAVRCAMDIDCFARGFAESQNRAGIPLGRTRIGVNTGSAIIGNFGGELFFDYTAHGDAINVAARLEGANKHLGTHICVSGSTVAEIPDFHGRPIGELLLKGREAPLMTLEPLPVAAANSPETKEYRAAYGLLETGDAAGARKAFAALVSRYGDDPLALFHLRRLLAGRTNVKIELAEK